MGWSHSLLERHEPSTASSPRTQIQKKKKKICLAPRPFLPPSGSPTFLCSSIPHTADSGGFRFVSFPCILSPLVQAIRSLHFSWRMNWLQWLCLIGLRPVRRFSPYRSPTKLGCQLLRDRFRFEILIESLRPGWLRFFREYVNESRP